MTEAQAAIAAPPISGTEPCGPDLEAAGDRDYLTILARAQGELPSSYFEYLYPESEDDRLRIDFAKSIGDLTRLAARSHDLRVLALRARFQILARDLVSFQASLTTIAALLGAFWTEVYPRAEGDSVDLRRIELEGLEAPTIVFPLQYVPLCENRRIGPVSYRMALYAQNAAKPRQGESAPSAATIRDALRDGDPDEIKRSREALASLVEALTSIRATWQEHTGESPPLAKLLDLTRAIAGLMDQSAPTPPTATDTAAAVATGGGPAPAPAGEIASAADAAAALVAMAGYYRRFEPSSPVLPLVEQASRLRGRSFFEALQVLLPSYAEEASFKLGSQWIFDIVLSRMAGSEDAPPPAAEGPDDLAGKTWDVTTRQQALALGAQVVAFYRLREPSSPIPLLLDRATGLAERDFLTLLRDVLPKSALRDASETP